MTVSPLQLILPIAIAFGLTWLTCLLMIPLAHRYELFDRPDGKRKLHAAPIPLLGGMSILAGVVLSLMTVAGSIGLPFHFSFTHGLGFGLTSVLLCGLGLYDDLYHLRPKIKLLWQVILIVPFLLLCPVVSSIQLFGMTISLGSMGWLFTGLFLIAAINALNLIDGVDGLAGSVSLIVFLAAAVHALLIGAGDIACLLLIASGSLAGFLLHNWAPARIYLGDSGSHLVGFWVGAFALASSTKTVTGLTLSVPVVLLSLPAFDTALAILRRLLIQRSIAEPDRLHIHHQLLSRGLSPAKVTLLIALLSSLMASFALTGAYLQWEWLSWGGCLLVLATSMAFKLGGAEELKLLKAWWAGTLEPVITEEERAAAQLPAIPVQGSPQTNQVTSQAKKRAA
ncbi:MAG: undecaprenyl/decaprenyl-phosphate alpha-N-acetylglucosaminyl 1-phosphate transferase [Planctomycetaceae bacterium]|nr:undecaprenyl/decaprenyl-phosphate alpha-N-acetylglucosaminyl 1-phosphate transferase [Planctomycetaceae bacterium]